MVYSAEINVTRVRSRATFGIRVDFNKQEGDPSRVFVAISELIKACEEIDRKLVRAIQVDVEPILILEDVESGSISAWLRNQFNLPKNASELGLDSEKLSEYLTESKFAYIDYLSNTTTVTNDGVSHVQQKVFEILQGKDPVPNLPIHNDVPKKDILRGMQQLQSALTPLSQSSDSAEYMFDNQKTAFNLSLELTPGSIEDLLVSRTLVNTNTLILKVKKPDYLGASQWEFKHGGRSIDVKIKDLEWLGKFHKREVILAPGDSLEAEVEVIAKYDIDNELLSTQYTLITVIACIQAPKSSQLLLPIPKEE